MIEGTNGPLSIIGAKKPNRLRGVKMKCRDVWVLVNSGQVTGAGRKSSVCLADTALCFAVGVGSKVRLRLNVRWVRTTVRRENLSDDHQALRWTIRPHWGGVCPEDKLW